ncbi:MAG: hypothetical protein QXG08_06400, partial [Candidatus Methanomethyliaceae archaeon]
KVIKINQIILYNKRVTMSIEGATSIIIGTIVGAILTIIIQEIIHPPLKHKINKIIKSISKRIRDPIIPTRYYLKSELITGKALSIEVFTSTIKSVLEQKNYFPEVLGDTIKIKNFHYEKTTADVTITLGIKLSLINDREPYVSSIGIEISGLPHYNSFYEEVLAYSQIGNIVKDLIERAIERPISMFPSLSCEINHLDKITSVLSDMKMTYVSFHNGYNIELGKRTATLHKIVGPEGIKSLKMLIQLYH